jgi:hypothetical protein
MMVSVDDKLTSPNPAVPYTLGGVANPAAGRFVASPRITPPVIVATPGTVMVCIGPAAANVDGPVGSGGTVSKLMRRVLADAVPPINKSVLSTVANLDMTPPSSLKFALLTWQILSFVSAPGK